MTKINNGEIIRKLINEAKINTAHDVTPTQLAEKIIAVLNVNPDKQINVGYGECNDATTNTLFTTSTTKDTFLIGGSMSISKDAGATSVESTILLTPFGKAVIKFMAIRYRGSTAGEHSKEVILPFALKLARGTTVTHTNSAAATAINNLTSVYYYEVETDEY